MSALPVEFPAAINRYFCVSLGAFSRRGGPENLSCVVASAIWRLVKRWRNLANRSTDFTFRRSRRTFGQNIISTFMLRHYRIINNGTEKDCQPAAATPGWHGLQ
ncbi:hypothetical protein KCP76_20800 [Salmonella enterica subsp. enterica serovar Weltevreden]|nr:hypothetical protein KCP76_20800 [Salmonella enterica subsp. enterica serovar Weltevreden]